MGTYCGAKHPTIETSACVALAQNTHVHHRDISGRQWANEGVASEFEEIRGDREDQLRQLLSYCRTRAEEVRGHYLSTEASESYNDVANKLREILDGEQ